MINSLIIIVAQYAIFVLPIFILIAYMKLEPSLRQEYILSLLLGGAIGLVAIFIASHLFYDPRPFMTSHVVPLFPHASDNGFPSDHTTAAIVLACVTLFYSRRIGGAMLLLAVCIGSARVFAHVHSWIDIAGGIIVGVIAASLAVFMIRLYADKFNKRSQQVI